MTKSVFTEWFHEQFILLVKQFLKKQKLPQKTKNHNCPSHPDEDDMKSKDGFVRVMF